MSIIPCIVYWLNIVPVYKIPKLVISPCVQLYSIANVLTVIGLISKWKYMIKRKFGALQIPEQGKISTPDLPPAL